MHFLTKGPPPPLEPGTLAPHGTAPQGGYVAVARSVPGPRALPQPMAAEKALMVRGGLVERMLVDFAFQQQAEPLQTKPEHAELQQTRALVGPGFSRPEPQQVHPSQLS